MLAVMPLIERLKISDSSGCCLKYLQTSQPSALFAAISPVCRLYIASPQQARNVSLSSLSADQRSDPGASDRSRSATGVNPKRPPASSAKTPTLASARSRR